MVRADGTVVPPFDGGKSIIGPWGIAIDGDDNVWVAKSTGRSVTKLCGAFPANCPPGTKTGEGNQMAPDAINAARVAATKGSM
jgi:hypothetical protein